jgi:tetratricopeptide (TPR) repeat protein
MSITPQSGPPTAAFDAGDAGAEAGARPPAPRWRWWPAILIPLLVFAAFAPGVRNGWVGWDDYDYIRNNPLLSQPGGLLRIWSTLESPQYYPLTFTLHWLEYRLWGDWPTGYFTLGLLLHAANALLVFAIIRALGASTWLAFLAAALFGLHPIQVASVAWLAERKNLLSGLFYLLSLLAFMRHRNDGRAGHYVACLVLFACAMLSKSSAVSLPLVLVLYDRLILRASPRSAVVRVVPLLLIAVAPLLVAAAREQVLSIVHTPLAQRPLIAAAALWFYASKFVWPVNLLAVYPRWDVQFDQFIWWLPLLGLLVCGVALWRDRERQGPLVCFGLACYVATMLPAIGLVHFGFLQFSPVADHLAYLGVIGLALVVSAWLERLIGAIPAPTVRSGALYSALTVLAAAAGAATFLQTQLWHDAFTLFTHTLKYNPQCAPAYENIGYALIEARRFDQALAALTRQVELAPGNPKAHSNRGGVLREIGRREEALQEFERTLELDPQHAAAYFNLGSTLFELGRPQEAAERFRQGLKLAPREWRARQSLAEILRASGDDDGALAQLMQALESAPEDADVLHAIGAILLNQRKSALALPYLEAAARVRPKSARIQVALGDALAAQKKFEQALACHAQAIQLDPQYAEAYHRLGRLLHDGGQLAEASRAYREALRLKPDWPLVQIFLARILATAPDAALRDPQDAVRLAEAACDAPQTPTARWLDTLAAAYAAVEDYDKAVAAAQRALQAAGRLATKDLAERIQQNLVELREKRNPYIAATAPTSEPAETP